MQEIQEERQRLLTAGDNEHAELSASPGSAAAALQAAEAPVLIVTQDVRSSGPNSSGSNIL